MVDVVKAYRGLAEHLACDGPGGHAHRGTCQHGGNKPSKRQGMDGKEVAAARGEGGRRWCTGGRRAGGEVSQVKILFGGTGLPSP